jgi:hypothetical protein
LFDFICDQIIIEYISKMIHIIHFFSICESLGEMILSFNSTLFGEWVSNQNQVELIILYFSSPTRKIMNFYDDFNISFVDVPFPIGFYP